MPSVGLLGGLVRDAVNLLHLAGDDHVAEKFPLLVT